MQEVKAKNIYWCYMIYLGLVILAKLPVFIMGFYTGNIPLKGDEYIHLLISYYPLGWQSFTGVFPFGSIILLKLFNYNIAVYKIFLFVFSSLAWSYPLFIINYFKFHFSKYERIIFNLVLLLFISSIAVTSWDNNIGSDSLTLSTLVIILSTCFLFFINKQTNFNMVIFIATSTYFVLLRDSNYLIMLLIIMLLFKCKNISIRFKLISVAIIFSSILITVLSAAELRSRIHFRDILAMYIVENDSAVQQNKDYYKWYMENTTMPDVLSEYKLCNNSVLSSDISLKLNGIPTGLPVFPFEGSYSNKFISPHQANYISSYLTGENCLPFKDLLFNNYFYSNNLSRDYVRFLINHPAFILFGSGKYLPLTRFLIFSPAKIPYVNADSLIIVKIMQNYKIIFYMLLHVFYLILQIVIWKNIIYSNKKIRMLWLLWLLGPAIIFAWLCFIAEPLELSRHLLAGEWYMIVGGLYLVLWYKFNANDSDNTFFINKGI